MELSVKDCPAAQTACFNNSNQQQCLVGHGVPHEWTRPCSREATRRDMFIPMVFRAPLLFCFSLFFFYLFASFFLFSHSFLLFCAFKYLYAHNLHMHIHTEITEIHTNITALQHCTAQDRTGQDRQTDGWTNIHKYIRIYL